MSLKQDKQLLLCVLCICIFCLLQNVSVDKDGEERVYSSITLFRWSYCTTIRIAHGLSQHQGLLQTFCLIC
jgi:hypothetical protein